jgi:hypothetical protein
MGIHSGPVNEITDLNEQANIAGAGINAAGGKMYVGPRKYATTKNTWSVKDGKFCGSEIVTLTDKKFVYREIGGHGTATLI